MDQPLIKIENVIKCFGSNCVLNGVTLNIYRGQITSIIGQSGMGKSVLLKHIIGLLTPDSGQVLFEGKPLVAMKKDERKPTTTDAGIPVASEEFSLTVGPDGPISETKIQLCISGHRTF